jgi:hypothetical protein
MSFEPSTTADKQWRVGAPDQQPRSDLNWLLDRPQLTSTAPPDQSKPVRSSDWSTSLDDETRDALAELLVATNDKPRARPLSNANTSSVQMHSFSNYSMELAHFQELCAHYFNIFERQAKHASEEIQSELSSARQSDDADELATHRASIARLVELLGEPGLAAIKGVLSTAKADIEVYSLLLLGLAEAADKPTAEKREALAYHYALSPDAKIRHAAISALAEMHTDSARERIASIASTEANPRLRNLIRNYLK